MLQSDTVKSIEIASSIDEIIGMYEISENDDEEKIIEFIENHEHIIPILKEAKEYIISVFGDCVRIILELYYDVEEGWEQLFIIIKSPYKPDKALELELKLGDEWFLDKIAETKGDLIISEESL